MARRARKFRRDMAKMARNWDESAPVPTRRGISNSMCPYGCCW